MKRLSILIILLQGLAFANYASPVDELKEEEKFILRHLDSLTHELFQSNFTRGEYDTSLFSNNAQRFYPVFNDSIVLKNLLTIPTDIPLAFNNRVKRYIEVYSIEHRNKVEEMLGLSELYFPIFEEQLDKRNMPHLLKYLPVVESALNANAVSKAGATGLWQIMYSTGKMLGLNINSYIDERRDPNLSTDAALTYLSSLYRVYGDWLLVIAAYNCGPGNLNRAIARSGGERNYWKIINFLPRETRGYVPAFLGAMYVMMHKEDYELQQRNLRFSFNAIDTVMLTRQIELSLIAEELNADYEELLFLNPALRKKIVPPSKEGYALKLPVDKLVLFEAKKDSMYLKIPDPAEAILASSNVASTVNSPSEAYNNQNNEKMSYTVKPGDNLGYIAEWYNCAAQDIRNWNGIYGSNIKVGQKLVIYVPRQKADQYANIDKLSFYEKQKRKKSPGNDHTSKIEKDPECNCVYYKVRSGDTLWDISKKYRVEIDEIKKQNNISNGKHLKPGMVLKIMI